MMNKRGFTLVELMIVVVIIGILAALAVPRFNVSSYRAKEKEAEVILKHVYSMQQAYHSQYGAYAASSAALAGVGYQEPGNLENYTWAGDASIGNNVCLVATGSHSSRRIDFATGDFSDC